MILINIIFIAFANAKCHYLVLNKNMRLPICWPLSEESIAIQSTYDICTNILILKFSIMNHNDEFERSNLLIFK